MGSQAHLQQRAAGRQPSSVLQEGSSEQGWGLVLLLCGAAQYRPPAACKTAWAEQGAATMRPGAICLQPLSQMVCKDSWGGRSVAGIHFTKHPASPGASNSPTNGHCHCDCTDQKHEAQNGPVTSEGHTARKWWAGFERRAS